MSGGELRRKDNSIDLDENNKNDLDGAVTLA